MRRGISDSYICAETVTCCGLNCWQIGVVRVTMFAEPARKFVVVFLCVQPVWKILYVVYAVIFKTGKFLTRCGWTPPQSDIATYTCFSDAKPRCGRNCLSGCQLLVEGQILRRFYYHWSSATTWYIFICVIMLIISLYDLHISTVLLYICINIDRL